MESLVTTGWLAGAIVAAAAIEAAPLRIVDASYFLPGSTADATRRDAAAEFTACHIPGAVFMELETLVDADSPLPAMLPSASAFAARMGSLGIAADDRIVVYDDSPLRSAARAWWMLRLFGARHVAILDGGLASWIAEGRAVERGIVAAVPAQYTAPVSGMLLRTQGDVTANLATGIELTVDARAPGRFAGTEPEPRPGTLPGHIPGSVNLPYQMLFDADGRWKQGTALCRAFLDAGIDLHRPLTTTCGSGITACVLAFGAHLLGVDAAVYDGSWAEWGSDPATPKATSPKATGAVSGQRVCGS